MKTESSRVAVIIPVYNRPEAVLRAASSVLQQTRLPQRLIIVDDGSTDATLEHLEQWLPQQDPTVSVQLVPCSRQGKVSAARNRGLQILASYADCDYVLFLDSDDELPPDFIQRSAAKLDAAADLVAVSAPRRSISAGEQVLDDLTDFVAAPLAWMLYYGGALLSCTLFRLTALPEDGFMDSLVIGEDLVFATLVSLAGNWGLAPGLAVNFWRLPSTAEESSITLRYNPQHDLTGVQQSICARQQSVKLYNESTGTKLQPAYVSEILRDWYGLAARTRSGLARHCGTYARLALYYAGLRRWQQLRSII